MRKNFEKLSLILSLMLLITLLSSCSSSKLAEDFDEDNVKKAAEEVILYLNNKDTEGLHDKSTLAVKTALTEEVMETVYEGIGEGGAFIEILEISIGGKKDPSSEEEFAVAVVKAKYELKNFIYTITFTKQMKLAGLFYK